MCENGDLEANHETYGFHMHTRLPEDADAYVELSVKDHHEAQDSF